MNATTETIARRGFLRQSCGAMSSVPMLSTILSLRMIGTASAVTAPGPGDYRALVCFFFPGGYDSFNVLVPRGADANSAEYQQYAGRRGNLALPHGDLHQLNPQIPDPQGRGFGLHPGLDDLQGLFNGGDLAFIANVGTLIEPVASFNDLKSGLRALPKGLYSHSDQIKEWQTSVPQDRRSIGWGGRMGDVLNALNDPSHVSMNISLSSTNVYQSGNSVFEYAINPSGADQRNGYTGTTGRDAIRGAGVDSLLEQEYSNIFEQAFANKHRNVLQAAEVFNDAVGGVSAFNTPVPTHSDDSANAAIPGLAAKFEMIAKTIAARANLGVRRQTFFIKWGGWDHHSGVIDPQAWMLPVVGRCMKYFHDLLGEINMQDQVTLFTASDFGRTLTSNGRGSDHAWGGNHMVMGGAVKGGNIYGEFPSLANSAQLDTGRGRQIPSTACDLYFAELAQWMGVSAADLDYVLPNINNFYTPSSTAPPIGFMD